MLNTKTEMAVRKHLQLPFMAELSRADKRSPETYKSWKETTHTALQDLLDVAAKQKRDFTEEEKIAFDEGIRLIDYWSTNPAGGRQVPPEQPFGVESESLLGAYRSSRSSRRGPAPRFVAPDGREIRGLWGDESIATDMQHNLPDGIRAEELSLGRIVKAQVTGNWRGAEAEKRALGNSPDLLGGYLLPSPIAAEVIDLARNKAVIFNADAVTIPMTSNTQTLAKLTADPGIGWKVENQPSNFSDATFGKLVLTARTLMALCSASVELVEDAGNLDEVLRNSLAQVLALELDRAALRGDGSASAPVGIRFAQNVQIRDQGVNGASWATAGLAFSEISNSVQLVKNKNGEPNALIYAPRTWGQIDRLLDTLGQPIRPPASFEALEKFDSNQIPINLTKGSSNVSSEVYVGDFSNMLVGMRTELNVEVTRSGGDSTGSAFRNLQVWIRAYLRADVVLRHPEWFVVCDGVIP